MHKKQRGFTLIELLVVVIILGVLAGLAIPQYFKVVERGKLSEAVAVLGALRSGELAEYSVEGKFAAFASLDIEVNYSSMKFFGTPSFATSDATSGTFEIRVQRSSGSGRYGNYTICINEKGELQISGGTTANTGELGYDVEVTAT